MHSLTLFAGLAACVSAQLMPLSEIANIKFPANQGPVVGKGAGHESIPYNSNAVYQSTYNNVFASGKTTAKRNIFKKRHDGGDCSPQPLGAGPVPSPDTPEAFLADTDFSNAANGAVTPSGWVRTFQNLKASSQVPMGYLGYDSVSSYDPSICAAKCDALSGCFAFDLYFERDPTIDPGATCTNPSSTTIIKCAYWGTTLEKDTATNDGQYCADFHIVIAGSNGYVRQKTGYPIPGYDGTFIGDSAINAPTDCNSYIGYQVFNDGSPFDPNRCAAACKATTDYNIQYLNSRAICRFFDTYVLSKNGVPQGQYCAMYTRSWDASYATNNGQTDTDGNKYTISYSYTYSNSTDPGAQICDAKCMSQNPCPGSSSSSSTTISTTWTTSGKSTTTGRTTTPSVSTTASTSASSSSSSVSTSCTTKSTITSSTLSSTTAKMTTTTTKPYTTLQTTTKSTTTTTASTPTSTTCFKLHPLGPSYLTSKTYVSLDPSFKFTTSTTAATIFTLDNVSRLIAQNGKPVSRTVENWFNPWWGMMSTSGVNALSCTRQGTELTCKGLWGQNTIWAQNSGAVAHGVCPGNGWDQISLSMEWVDCPIGQGGDKNVPWKSWNFGGFNFDFGFGF